MGSLKSSTKWDCTRRNLIDFATNVTFRARNIVLNVTKSVYETLNIDQLWTQCQSPPQIQLVE